MIHISSDAARHCIHLSNGRVSYVIHFAAGRYPVHIYWGKALRDVQDNTVVRRTGRKSSTLDLNETPLDRLPQECPVFGCGDMREGMLQARHADGTEALELRAVNYRVEDGKPELPGLPSARGEGARTLVLTLRDEASGVEADLNYTLWEDTDVIARSAVIRNTGSTPVTVEKALSFCLDLEDSDYDLLTFQGAWAREREWTRRPLVMGDQGNSSVRGASSHQANPFLVLSRPGCTEEAGECMGFALCWSGSFLANVHVDQFRAARVMMGIQPFDFSWTLGPGESFTCPEAYLAWSGEGLGGLTDSFRALIHGHLTTGAYARTERPILINNWEATYFGFDEEKLLSIARKAKEMGVELFVLDDGWFGKRDSDNCSLGDWTDDLRKLPHGLKGLSEKIHAMGLKFGFWVEPEMVSPDSDLYRAHPDWCIHAGDRPRLENRNQLVLDLTRPDVRDYITETISAAIRRADADYVKWDMNRNINMIGSAYLPPEKIRELPVRYILGVYEVMRRITAAFPQVLFESCAGGGGRFDLGILSLMPQGWTSDDTDAWMRCRIQYSTSLLFPPSAMGAHVSAVPNHQTGRVSPLATRAAVAMGGTFGYELDPTKLSDEEIEAIRGYNRRFRDWQKDLFYGRFLRLRSPYETDECAWMTVSPDGKRAAVTHVYRDGSPNEIPGLLRLRGLDPDADYRDTDTGAVYGGDELMYRGLPLYGRQGDYSCRQFFLEKTEEA